MIYVTGSSGVLGNAILSHLVVSGIEACGVSRRPLPVPDAGLANIETPDVLGADWVTGPGATIVHCAGLASPRVPFDSYADVSRREIEPQVAFAEALVASGWRGHLVYLSSAGVYGDTDDLPIPENASMQPKGWYPLQKMATEQALMLLAQRHGFRLTILRVANVYGAPLAGPSFGVVTILLDKLRSGAPFAVFGSGESLRDYIYVSDFCTAVARACAATLPEPVTVLNIGTGVGTSLLRMTELVPRIAGGRLELRREPVASEVKSSVLDISRTRSLLGWEPVVELEEGLRRTVAMMGT